MTTEGKLNSTEVVDDTITSELDEVGGNTVEQVPIIATPAEKPDVVPITPVLIPAEPTPPVVTPTEPTEPVKVDGKIEDIPLSEITKYGKTGAGWNLHQARKEQQLADKKRELDEREARLNQLQPVSRSQFTPAQQQDMNNQGIDFSDPVALQRYIDAKAETLVNTKLTQFQEQQQIEQFNNEIDNKNSNFIQRLIDNGEKVTVEDVAALQTFAENRGIAYLEDAYTVMKSATVQERVKQQILTRSKVVSERQYTAARMSVNPTAPPMTPTAKPKTTADKLLEYMAHPKETLTSEIDLT